MDLEDTLYAITPGSNPPNKAVLSKGDAKGHAFMVCGLYAAMNEAGALFKKNHCHGPGGGNMEKTLELFKTF